MERKFKIGDFVNYEGKKCEVLAYSGKSYTININDKRGHDGRSYSYDEQGNKIDPHCDTCWYVVEGEITKWKNNMKHKVGDIIRIKSIDWYNENKDEDGDIKLTNDTFVSCMKNLCGNEYKIWYVGRDGYFVKGYPWKITEEMIDGGITKEDEGPQLRYFLISYRTNNGFANATFKEVNIPSFKRMREVIGCDFTLINLMELSRDDFESLTENKI
jgi:hypothetical protein